MPSLNQVTLLGHLGKKPETKSGPNGSSFVTFSIATSESWKNKTTNVKESRTEWHNVIVTNPTSMEFATKYLDKGSLVYIEGAIRSSKWTDKSGQEKTSFSIIVAPFKGQLLSLAKDSSETTSKGDTKSWENY